MYTTHNAVRDTVEKILRRAGCTTVSEPVGELEPHTDSKGKAHELRVDIYAPTPQPSCSTPRSHTSSARPRTGEPTPGPPRQEPSQSQHHQGRGDDQRRQVQEGCAQSAQGIHPTRDRHLRPHGQTVPQADKRHRRPPSSPHIRSCQRTHTGRAHRGASTPRIPEQGVPPQHRPCPRHSYQHHHAKGPGTHSHLHALERSWTRHAGGRVLPQPHSRDQRRRVLILTRISSNR